jgi:hypothetical protein
MLSDPNDKTIIEMNRKLWTRTKNQTSAAQPQLYMLLSYPSSCGLQGDSRHIASLTSMPINNNKVNYIRTHETSLFKFLYNIGGNGQKLQPLRQKIHCCLTVYIHNLFYYCILKHKKMSSTKKIPIHSYMHS